MKLATLQIVLGVLILLIDSLAVGGVLSTHFTYLQPHGDPIQAVRPEALKVARWATIAVVPLALAVIGCGIAQVMRLKKP